MPIGFGIILGAVIALVCIGVLKGRTRFLMIFATALMTAGTGAMSAARTNNLPTVYGVITIASLGVGMVIIPCSIIAQLACPHHLIGTITAITLSIRYIGGAIGFTAYYNVFYHKFTGYATKIVAPAIVENQIAPLNIKLITEMIDLAGTAQFDELKKLIASVPTVPAKLQGGGAFDIVVGATQEAFALAYRYPWVSLRFVVVITQADSA